MRSVRLAAFLTMLVREGDIFSSLMRCRLSGRWELLYGGLTALEDYAGSKFMMRAGAPAPESIQQYDRVMFQHAGGRCHPCGRQIASPWDVVKWCAAQAGLAQLFTPMTVEAGRPALGGHPRPIWQVTRRRTSWPKCSRGTPRGKPLLEACPLDNLPCWGYHRPHFSLMSPGRWTTGSCRYWSGASWMAKLLAIIEMAAQRRPYWACLHRTVFTPVIWRRLDSCRMSVAE